MMKTPAKFDVDLLIVGGGINGTGIARDAAGRGLSVLLVEQDDLASHTSSASTKLIHGGLRYLEYGELRLVREALIERERLLAIAPHISTSPIGPVPSLGVARRPSRSRMKKPTMPRNAACAWPPTSPATSHGRSRGSRWA